MTDLPKGHQVEVDEAYAAAVGIQYYPGFISPFTRDQAPGALPNGTRVVKVKEDDSSDLHSIGEMGTILGSLSHPAVGIGYFVQWDSRPRMPTFVVAGKIKEGA